MASDWQRLPPWSILFFVARALGQIVNLYPVLIAAGFTVSQFDLHSTKLLSLGIGLMVLILVGAILYYWNFQYCYDHEKLRVKTGVFAKNRLELPFSRIQNITLREPFYFRPLGLVILSMDSAGSNQQEVQLAALSRPRARALQDAIRTGKKEQAQQMQVESENAPDAADSTADKLLLTRSPADIIVHGITNNRAWIILALAAPLFSQLESTVFAYFETLGLEIQDNLADVTLLIAMGFVLIFVLGIVLIVTAFSVLGALFALYDFQLFATEDGYRRHSGLLTRHEIRVKGSRIQTLKWQQNWMERIIRRCNLVMEPFAASGMNELQSLRQKILVPNLTEEQFNRLGNQIIVNLEFSGLEYHPISKQYLTRYALLGILPALLAALVFSAYSELPLWLMPTVILLVGPAALWLRWRRYGYAKQGDILVIRKGFIGVSYYCFQLHKVQQTGLLQSWFLERKKLATVQFVLASRTLLLPMIDSATAHEFIRETLYRTEAKALSWM